MIIKLEDVADRIHVPKNVKAKLQTNYSLLYTWTASNYKNRKVFKQSTVNKINMLIYYLLTDGDVPYDWKSIVESPRYDLPLDEHEVQSTVAPYYFDVDVIEWDVNMDVVPKVLDVVPETPKQLTKEDEVNTSLEENEEVKSSTKESIEVKQEPERVYTFEAKTSTGDKYTASLTPKEDLFLTVPAYPRIGPLDTTYTNIHVSLPQIPTKQSDVSVTTQVNWMSDADLMKLYPNHLVRTRSPLMYQERSGITMDPDFGLLVPVNGYTDAQVRDCIIRYPHIFKIMRVMEDGTYRSFYNDIEIDGELVNILEAWKYLPEAKIIDIDSLSSKSEQVEFMKEYAIRRYLLERDVGKIKHKYEIRGTLPEFMTLFMPASRYKQEGIIDVVELARMCVKARISYLSSRNPRIVGPEPTVNNCVFGAFCCEQICDRSCTKWAQMDYLMMRNGLDYSSRPFQLKQESLDRYIQAYESSIGKTIVFTSKDTIKSAEALAYVAVCNKWKGSAMRVKSFHLMFSKYVDALQSSWGNSKTDDVAYSEIWSKSSDVLIISGMDYVNFKDYQSQLLLQLVQDREREGKTTILVCPRIENVMGSGKMYSLLISKMKQTCHSLD